MATVSSPLPVRAHDFLRVDDLLSDEETLIRDTVRAYVREQLLPEADLVIGAVLVRGARAPKLVHRDDLAPMRAGSVLVDVSIDQGGCFETSRPTTHADPTYVVDGVVHYCVTNMPGAVPCTSTWALTNATLPYVVALADLGPDALAQRPGLAAGLTVAGGAVVHPVVRAELGAAAHLLAAA